MGDVNAAGIIQQMARQVVDVRDPIGGQRVAGRLGERVAHERQHEPAFLRANMRKTGESGRFAVGKKGLSIRKPRFMELGAQSTELSAQPTDGQRTPTDGKLARTDGKLARMDGKRGCLEGQPG